MKLIFLWSEDDNMLVITRDNSDSYNFCVIACYQKYYYTNMLSSLSELIFYDPSLKLLLYICLDTLILYSLLRPSLVMLCLQLEEIQLVQVSLKFDHLFHTITT